MSFIDALQLPSSARIHLNLPKNLLKKHGFADALLDEFAVQNGKTQCYDNALIAPRTCAIPVYQDETCLYDEIHVIELEVKTSKHLEKLEDTFFKSIPYALILVVHCDAQTRISLAHFRTNIADKSQNVITDIVHSQWFSGDACDFFCPNGDGTKKHLFALYSLIFDNIVLDNVRLIWPNIDTTPENALSLLRQYNDLQKKCEQLKASRKPDMPFAKKCMLSQEIQYIKARIDNLPNQNKDELILSNGDSHSKTLF